MDDIEETYVVVDTIHSFSHKYVIPMSELQKENLDMPVDPAWALDAVTMEEAEEFSQKALGEQIVDFNVVSEKEILEIFDKHNDYLANWSVAEKLQFIKTWKSDIK